MTITCGRRRWAVGWPWMSPMMREAGNYFLVLPLTSIESCVMVWLLLGAHRRLELLLIFLAVESCACWVRAHGSDLLRLAHLPTVRSKRTRANLLGWHLDHCLRLIDWWLVSHRVMALLASFARSALILILPRTILAGCCSLHRCHSRAVEISRWQKWLFLLRSLLNLCRDATILCGGELVENSSQFIRLVDIAEENKLIDILGTLSKSLLL